MTPNRRQNGVEKWLKRTLEDEGDGWWTEAGGEVTAYAYHGRGHDTPADCPVSVTAEQEPDGSLFVSVATPGARGFHEETAVTVTRDWDEASLWLADKLEEIL